MKQPWFRGLSYYWVVDQALSSGDTIPNSEKLSMVSPELHNSVAHG